MFVNIITSKNLPRTINTNHIVSIDVIESSFNVDTPFGIRVAMVNRTEEILGPWPTQKDALNAHTRLIEEIGAHYGRN